MVKNKNPNGKDMSRILNVAHRLNWYLISAV